MVFARSSDLQWKHGYLETHRNQNAAREKKHPFQQTYPMPIEFAFPSHMQTWFKFRSPKTWSQKNTRQHACTTARHLYQALLTNVSNSTHQPHGYRVNTCTLPHAFNHNRVRRPKFFLHVVLKTPMTSCNRETPRDPSGAISIRLWPNRLRSSRPSPHHWHHWDILVPSK